MFVDVLSNFCRTTVVCFDVLRPAFYILPSASLCCSVLRPIVLSSWLLIWHLFDFRPSFVRPLLDVSLTSI